VNSCINKELSFEYSCINRELSFEEFAFEELWGPGGKVHFQGGLVLTFCINSTRS